ncbi:MAG TPA: MTH1187 family thiamine-binding protein [Bacteroidales bacterium]|nr:MTH1187 family thiamine-binding protein [Bacteroidales bacterium]
MSVLLEFSMFPTDKGESVSPYVSRIIKMIRASGLNYQLTPMGTVVEAPELAEILELVQKAYQELEPDCQRVYSSLKLDIRKGPVGRLEGKVRSVEEKIGEVKK